MEEKEHKDSDVNIQIESDTNNLDLRLNRTILFYEEIDEVSALHLNRLLLSIDKKLWKKYNKKKAYIEKYNGVVEKPVINLRIQSQGGDVFAALSIIDIIGQLQSDIHTYVDGGAASGAAMIAISGTKRYIGKNSFMLFHQLRGSQSGKYEDMQDEIRNNEKIMNLIRELVRSRSNIPLKEVNEILKHEWWLTSQECLDFGIVDEIV